MRRALSVVLVFAALLAVVPARAEMEVYRPKHRLAEDLAPLVETVMGAQGRIAVDGHSGAIVIVGPAELVAEALALLALQDRKLRTVFIHHETQTASDLEAAGARIRWSAGGNAFRIGNVDRRAGGSGASVGLRGRSGASEGSEVGMVRVLEGEWGRIASGTETLLPIGSFRYPEAVRVAAESGLEVRPRILGDGRVRLDLRPFQAKLGRGGTVTHAGADTTLVVTPGETAVVGGLGGARSSTSGSFTGGGRREQRSDRLMLVTVTIDGEDAAAR